MKVLDIATKVHPLLTTNVTVFNQYADTVPHIMKPVGDRKRVDVVYDICMDDQLHQNLFRRK